MRTEDCNDLAMSGDQVFIFQFFHKVAMIELRENNFLAIFTLCKYAYRAPDDIVQTT